MGRIALVAILAGTALVGGLIAPANADPKGWRGHGGGDRGHHHSRSWNRGGNWGWGSRSWHHDPGSAFWGGVLGGVVGNWLGNQQAERGRDIEEEEERDIEWCIRRYRSYDTYTKTYLGYDGLRHGCP